MLVVGSEHAFEAVEVAFELLAAGASALDAVVAAVRVVEDDPEVHSVGTGGYPHVGGAVELDASVMEGTRRRAGAVAALGGFAHPVSVAREVMERLPHVLLAGEGAARFAAEIGAEPAELLVDSARQVWLRAVEAARAEVGDDLLAQVELLTAAPSQSMSTVDVLALDASGRVASAVSTSGWPFRWPGRLADSCIPGAGNYCDDRFGAAACTGLGELAIRAGTARSVVAALAGGAAPEQAGREALLDVWMLSPEHREAPMNVVVLDVSGRHCGLSTEPGGTYVWRDERSGGPVRTERLVVSRPGTAAP